MLGQIAWGKTPGALASSVALHQADPRLQKIYRQHYITKERDFIDLIFFISEHGLEKVEEAILLLTKVSPLEVTTETIKAICGRNPIKKAEASVRSDTTIQIEAHSLDMLKRFGQLIPGDRKTFVKEVAVL